jgi:hypothetical protein
LEKKRPVSKSKGVLKSDSRQFVAAQKKNDDTKDDPILLLSNDDEAGKKLTMPKEAVEFFSTPWKHYVSVYSLVYNLFL